MDDSIYHLKNFVNFNTSRSNPLIMLETPQTITKEIRGAPKIGVGILLGILIFGIFVVGYDQGQLAEALFTPLGIHLNHDQLMLIHEFNHDLRHAAGFPCH
jgi:hypothetical protein